MSQSHPLVVYTINDETRCEDIAGAGYDIANLYGYSHENGCELWEEECKSLPDGRYQVGVVVSSDFGDEPELGMVWIGNMEMFNNNLVFRIHEVYKHGLVHPSYPYSWV